VINPANRTARVWDPNACIRPDDYIMTYTLPDGRHTAGDIHTVLACERFRTVWDDLGLRYTGEPQTNRRGLQPLFEAQRFAHEMQGFCAILSFLMCCVCQRLNTDRIDDVTDALVDWVLAFRTGEQRARLRFAVMLWIRHCYYARDYARLMEWIGVRAPDVYAADDAASPCGMWEDDARDFCGLPVWRPYTLCERHARGTLPEYRGSGSTYPVPPVDEWVDVERSDGRDGRLHLVPNDERSRRLAKRRRWFVRPTSPLPAAADFEWGPREMGPDHWSFMRPDTQPDDDTDDDNAPPTTWWSRMLRFGY
jgi:hypothetical protein